MHGWLRGEQVELRRGDRVRVRRSSDEGVVVEPLDAYVRVHFTRAGDRRARTSCVPGESLELLDFDRKNWTLNQPARDFNRRFPLQLHVPGCPGNSGELLENIAASISLTGSQRVDVLRALGSLPPDGIAAVDLVLKEEISTMRESAFGDPSLSYLQDLRRLERDATDDWRRFYARGPRFNGA